MIPQEPVAAALAYGFGRPTDWDTLLVFDLGGGTLDLSLIESFEGIMEVSEPCCMVVPNGHHHRHHFAPLHMQVVATGGDARLGGDDFTMATCDALVAALPAHLQEEWREGR